MTFKKNASRITKRPVVTKLTLLKSLVEQRDAKIIDLTRQLNTQAETIAKLQESSSIDLHTIKKLQDIIYRRDLRMIECEERVMEQIRNVSDFRRKLCKIPQFIRWIFGVKL